MLAAALLALVLLLAACGDRDDKKNNSSSQTNNGVTNNDVMDDSSVSNPMRLTMSGETDEDRIAQAAKDLRQQLIEHDNPSSVTLILED